MTMAAFKRYSCDDSEERVLSVVSEVEELHQTGLHTDCVLVGGGARIRCHTVMLASVSKVFRDILPQPGEEREDTVIVLADWGEEDVKSAVTMLYCGALAYRAGTRDKVGRVAALLESIGVQGFEEEVVDMGQEDDQSNANVGGLQIMDIRTIPSEELKTEVVSELTECDLVVGGDIRQPDVISIAVSSSSDNSKHQCLRCSGEFSSKLEYKLHLEEHIKDTKKCISNLKVKLKKRDKNTDWMCESCYIILLTDKDINEEECWNILNKHQKSCTEEVDNELKKLILNDDEKTQNQDKLINEEDIPTCDKCGKQFRLSIQLKKHKKSCTILVQQLPSLLSLLTAKDRAECPGCMQKMDPDNMDWHLLSSHGIRKHLEEDTPEEEYIYICSDSRCVLTWTSQLRPSYIYHKYVNCKHISRNKMDRVLERLTLADIEVVPVIEETSSSDKENNDGMMEVCSNEEKNNPNHHVPNEGCSVLGSVKNQVLTSNDRIASGRSSSGDEVVRSEACQKKPRDNSFDTNPMSLKCPQCLRVFRDTKEFQNSNKHFCLLVGKLREPLEEEKNPTSSMLVTLKCSICVGGPVLASESQYLRHLSLAHKGIFIVNQLKEKGLESGEGPCYCCSKELSGWEDAVFHVAIYHEKLFQALKHDPNNDYKILMKRFFPDKYKKWFNIKSKSNNKIDNERKVSAETEIQEDSNLEISMDTGISTMDINSSVDTQADPPPQVKATKRKLAPAPAHNEELELSIKIPRESVSESTGASEEDNTRPSTPKSPRSCKCKNCQLPDCRQCRFCQDRLAYGGEGKLRQRCEKRMCLMGKGKGKLSVPKDRLTCMICPSKSTKSYSNKTHLKQHMADAHFSEYILTHYPHPIASTNISYPCAFPNCSKILNSGSLRVKHLGAVHNQVDLCLAMPRLVEKAKEVANDVPDPRKQRHRHRSGQLRARSVSQDSDSLTCKTCNINFPTKEGFKLHTCHSLMDRSEQECMEELNYSMRARRPSNKETLVEEVPASVPPAPPALAMYDCVDSPVEVHGPAPPVLDIYDFVDSSEVQSPVEVAGPVSPAVDIYDFVDSPVTSNKVQTPVEDLAPVSPAPTTHDSPVTSTTTTPTKLQLMLSDSESEEEEPLSHVAKIRDNMKLLCSSDDDSDDNAESVPLDTLDSSDTPTPPGMVLEETVRPVTPYSCNVCHKIFESDADVEKHQQCEKCSPGNESMAIETCDKHTTCEYCHQCYNKGVDVHVTCDAARCKKCFSSEKEKREHFSKTHSWDDM